MPQWTFDALLDVREALEYIAVDDEAAAQRVGDRIVVASGRLDRFPKLGRPGPEPGMRQLLVRHTPYKIFYRLLGDGHPQILRVLHGARKWPP